MITFTTFKHSIFDNFLLMLLFKNIFRYYSVLVKTLHFVFDCIKLLEHLSKNYENIPHACIYFKFVFYFRKTPW